MPRYDYACAACGRRFEVVHGISEDGPTSCPLCGEGPVRKAFAPPAIHFKGSGWAKKERRATAAPSSATSTASDGGGDGSTSAGTSDAAGPSTGGTEAGAKDPAPAPAPGAGD